MVGHRITDNSGNPLNEDESRYSERIGVRLSQFQADLFRQYCNDFNQPISTTLRRALLHILLKKPDGIDFQSNRAPNEFASQAFTFRVTPDEREKLEDFADEKSRSYSTVIRTAVDELLWRVGY